MQFLIYNVDIYEKREKKTLTLCSHAHICSYKFWASVPTPPKTLTHSTTYTPFISSQLCGVKGVLRIMRFDVNAPKPHYLTPESKKPHSTWEVCYYLETREVFWKCILAKSRSLRRCGCQCERVHRIMWREMRL